MAKPALSYLPETTEEAREANLAYQTALERLTKTLDARKNQTFDPVMMAMAAGFLGPTTTGSFGEALGRAAGQVSKAQEAQYGQDIEAAKSQMELAQAGLQLQRQRGLDQATRQWLQGRGGQPTTTLVQPGGARPEGQPSGGLPSGRSAAPSGGLRVMDPDPTFMSETDYVAMNQNAGKSIGELLAEYQEKFGKHRFIKGDSGNLIDRQTGMLVPTTTGPNVTRQIIGLEDLGQVEMSQFNAMRLDEARRNGNPTEYYKIVEEVTGRTGLAPKTVAEKPAGSPAGAPPSTDEPAPITRKPGRQPAGTAPERETGIRSSSDIAAEAASKKVQAEERARGQEEARKAAMEKASAARDQILLADELKSFASRSDAKDIFGLPSQSAVANLVQLLQAGISLPGGSIGVAGLEDYYRQIKLEGPQLEAAQRFTQLATQMQLMMSQFVKGAVSNYEQGLFGKAGININDLPKTIRLKAEALKTRAEFDRDVGEILRKNPKLNTETIKDLSDYKMAEARLNERYKNIILRYQDVFTDKSYVEAAKQNNPDLLKPASQGSQGAKPAPGSLFDQIKKEQAARQ